MEEFEYRADHMTLDELEQITAESQFYSGVIKKLLSRGSKLVVGPRGVGKTHHMRIAYKQALTTKSKPLPIYMTLSKYLRLEPLKNSSSIAIQYFHCWALCKVLLGLKETFEHLEQDVESILTPFELKWEDLSLFCEQIEKQQVRDWHNALLDKISVRMVSNIIDDAILTCNRKHAILLCDDAALVLTKDYMIEFFDIFRALKSAKISPKASVYPNTEFGPRFHVGQDAESVPCWPSIADDEYVKLFDEIYSKRYSAEMKEDIKKCFMYASFGVPRAFINLINQFQNSSKTTVQSKLNSVIAEQAEIIMKEFKTLSTKQPQYKNYVAVGQKLINKIVADISAANKKSIIDQKQQFFLGVLQQDDYGKKAKDILLVIRLLEETGLLVRVNPVKHGKNSSGTRIYDRFIPHFTLLLNDGAYQVSKAGYASHFTELITLPKEKHPLRKNNFAEFLTDGDIDSLSLNLPSCSNCGSPRNTEEQRFCMFCGSELLNKSTFEELTSKKVDELPLTNWLKTKITEETRIETIADILFEANPAQELRKAKGVGEKKATRVIQEATRVMEEFLS
ncbi:helix-hairpin-helix domain-containing protein [Pseudoalteromonas aurantia]|uniref:Zinc ribbon domain-containing protein n=1 Tax=Pseudoalteromonas aurantia TaxID=43654 RepID=A0ABY2VUL4_9GAMM|nr:helix-hairpin-helix domain-containing protein [Pseudoalteromonas aurantia]TMO72012.1 hypothetical protein CWC20_16095 [Pseudoalteromonas aurantia]